MTVSLGHCPYETPDASYQTIVDNLQKELSKSTLDIDAKDGKTGQMSVSYS